MTLKYPILNIVFDGIYPPHSSSGKLLKAHRKLLKSIQEEEGNVKSRLIHSDEDRRFTALSTDIFELSDSPRAQLEKILMNTNSAFKLLEFENNGLAIIYSNIKGETEHDINLPSFNMPTSSLKIKKVADDFWNGFLKYLHSSLDNYHKEMDRIYKIFERVY